MKRENFQTEMFARSSFI